MQQWRGLKERVRRERRGRGEWGGERPKEGFHEKGWVQEAVSKVEVLPREKLMETPADCEGLSAAAVGVKGLLAIEPACGNRASRSMKSATLERRVLREFQRNLGRRATNSRS